jgi:hypothetical protein
VDSYELGLDTFGDIPTDDAGRRMTDGAAIRQVVDEAVLADQLGVDVFTVGEHHRPDYAVSAPEVVLAAIAARTSRMRVGTGVTVLSSDDPVRVHQRFATLDAIAPGRVEVIVGRGSFTESFPLFGYDLADYERLFEEKLELFVQLLDEKPVTWSGTLRAPLLDADVYPKTEAGRIPTWVGVGGTPQSVIRAARHGLPVMLAIIGGDPARFAPYVELYRRATQQLATPWACTPPASSPTPTPTPQRSCTRTTRRTATASARSEAGPPCGALSSTPRSLTARCTWARRRPSPARSRQPYGPWTYGASTSSTPRGPSRPATASARSSCTARRSSRW